MSLQYEYKSLLLLFERTPRAGRGSKDALSPLSLWGAEKYEEGR